MKLSIKNMVCDRCKKVVQADLENIGLKILNINLGNVEVEGQPDEQQLSLIKAVLERDGFEVLENPNLQVVEQIKNLIVQHIHHQKVKSETQNFSNFLAKKMAMNYAALSKIFSTHAEVTIEHFIIFQKIERAKELLVYGEKNLSEIAFDLDYSSVQHLSAQFKKVTGMTPSQFKKLKANLRKPLDKV